MIDSVTKRITELKALNRLSMHDKQMYRLPHIERTLIERVSRYVVNDKVVLINSNQEFCFKIGNIHIKSSQAKRLLYSRNAEKTFPLEDLVNKRYVQGFLVFINGYFIPWKYLSIICLNETNYLIVHVENNDPIGMAFIKKHRAGSLKVDIITIPNSYIYKELESPISGTFGEDFVFGFNENFVYTNTDVKYLVYCIDEDSEHSYNESIIMDSGTELISEESNRYYDKECCFVFNDGRLDTSVNILYTGSILNIYGQGNLSYVSCYNKRYTECANNISIFNQRKLYDNYSSLSNNEIFGELMKNNFDAKTDIAWSYFKNVKEFVNNAISYNSNIMMDRACNDTCSMKTFEFTGQEILDSCGDDHIFRISKFYDVALDDRIIVIKNGALYGLKSQDYRGQNLDLLIDRWRVISTQNIDQYQDEWSGTNQNNPSNTVSQDEWLSLNATNEVNEAILDEWLYVHNPRERIIDDDSPTDLWYQINNNSNDETTDNNDEWFEISNVIPTIFLELDTFDIDIKNTHIFNVPVIDVNPDDIIEFMLFQHTNNLTHDTIFYENDDYDVLSEDVYNLSTNIFCRETNDDYFEFPDNGVQHFPVSYRIESSGTDPYRRRIRYDDDFYYGKEIVLASKRRFIHKRHIISDEDASGICFDFGTKFMYCNNYPNYLIFFNGRRLNRDQYRLTLPVRSTTPFFWFYIYLGVYFQEGDVLDIYYTPTPMRDVFIGYIEEDGFVEVPKGNLRYPLNIDSYTFWANGYKVPKSKIKIIASNKLQLIDDMKTTIKFTVTEMVDELPPDWIIEDFHNQDSEWDRMIESIDLNLARSLLDIEPANQTDCLFEHQDLSTATLMHELILRWYYQSTYVDTTKSFIYDYQDYDTDLSAIKEFDTDDNAVLIATNNSLTNRAENAVQTHRYLP